MSILRTLCFHPSAQCGEEGKKAVIGRVKTELSWNLQMFYYSSLTLAQLEILSLPEPTWFSVVYNSRIYAGYRSL